MESKQYVEDIDFQKYWLILKRRWLPATSVFLLIIILAIAFAATRKPTYQASGKLLFKKKNTTSGLVTEAGGKIGELDTLSQLNTPVDTEAEVVASIPVIQKTIAALKLKDEKGQPLTPDDIFKQLTAKGIKGTDVLEVTFTSENPQEATDVVNQLMKVYIQHNILTNRAEAAAARSFIAKQLPEVEANVRKAEAALRNFKEQNNIVALDQEAIFAAQSMANLNDQISSVEATLADVTAQSQSLQNQLDLSPEQAIALNSLSQSRAVQQVVIDLEQIEDQLNVQRTRYQEQHPIIANLKRREAAQEELLKERVEQVIGAREKVDEENLQLGELKEKMIQDLVNTEVQRLGLFNKISSLSRAQTTSKERATILPRLQQGQRDLERQVEAAQSTYQLLLKNLQEVSIAENQNVGNANVIAYALVPEKPVGPKKKLILGGAMVAGSLLYIITAFLIDLMDPSIKTAKELRSLFRYTWLGMIPNWRKKGLFRRGKLDDRVPQTPVRDAPNAVISEAYRMLEANLKFLSPDKQLKVIVVTSSVSKEGKSTVSANLAAAMAQLGRRVLLIDGDMRHPVQHHIWDLTNVAGLSEVIVNQAEFKMAVREVMDKLDVLPAGVIPPNPLALLNSQRMASLIDEFSKSYDFVILDTPPLVLVADAITLGKMTDGILLVTRPGVVDRVSATASKEFLVRSGQAVLGLVVNGVKLKDEPDSYFHHAKTYCQDDLKPSKGVTRDKLSMKNQK